MIIALQEDHDIKIMLGLLQVGLLAGDGDTTLKLDPSYVIN